MSRCLLFGYGRHSAHGLSATNNWHWRNSSDWCRRSVALTGRPHRRPQARGERPGARRQPCRPFERDVHRHGGPHPDVALLQCRHEFAADQRQRPQTHHHAPTRNRHHDPFVREHPAQHLHVAPMQADDERGVLLARRPAQQERTVGGVTTILNAPVQAKPQVSDIGAKILPGSPVIVKRGMNATTMIVVPETIGGSTSLQVKAPSSLTGTCGRHEIGRW